MFAGRQPDWLSFNAAGYHRRSGMFACEIGGDKRGGLKGSMQHWLAVCPPEFQIPMFFVAVD
jgi:hypothetical protein